MAGLENPQTSDDPIASLYKMSTTAGMGAGDYVEVNKTAVASVCLAVLSLLSLLGDPFLLLGIVALVCGVVALRQIAHSNGTQGGRIVAWLGILGAVGIAGGVATVKLINQAEDAANGGKINVLIDQFSQAIAARDYPKARALFVEEFQERMPLEKFQSAWTNATESEQLGRFVAFRGNDRFSFSPGKGGVGLVGFTKAGLRFEKIEGPVGSITVVAVRGEGQEWKLSDMPEIFPKAKPASK